MGASKEAVSHYRDMLHLNPNDNQGIRYSLLNLLHWRKVSGAVEWLKEQM